jgi:hypothetical protein
MNPRWIAVALMVGVLLGACVWGALLWWGAS